MKYRRAGIHLSLVFVGLAAWHQALGQTYPSHPITIVVPLGAGGGVDVQARLIGQRLSERLNVAVVIENKPGGGTVVGGNYVAKSNPDGHTLLLATNSTIAVAPVVSKGGAYEPIRDFVPLAMTAGSPFFLAVRPNPEIQTLKDLLRKAGERSDQLSFGTSGIGTSNHIFMEMLMRRANIKMVHVPYKSSGEVAKDVIAGHVDIAFLDPETAIQMSKGGLVNLLGITTTKRHPTLPDVPTMAEAGVPDYEAMAWTALVAPAKISDAVAAKLRKELSEIVTGAEYQEFLRKSASLDMDYRTPESMQSFFQSEIAKWETILVGAGLKGVQ